MQVQKLASASEGRLAGLNAGWKPGMSFFGRYSRRVVCEDRPDGRSVKFRLFCAFGAGLASAAFAGCSAASHPSPTDSPARVIESSRLSMGSTLRLTAWTSDEAAAKAAFEEVFAEFARLEQLMSTWVPGSEVSRLNGAAGVAPVAVSIEMRGVLDTGRQVSEWTNGKFDVTFGALSGFWKFDHDQKNALPDMREVRRRLAMIDYRAIQVDNAAGTVFISRKDMSIHLGGIGKGYAIDRGADILRRREIRDFMIQSGGDIYVGGLKDGRPWRLGIQDPRGPADRSFAELDLSDGTFSTSGDYERAFMKDGRRYHHIVDPATGEPARGTRSVTIVANRAVIADGLSTGVFIMGPAEGMALIERLPDVEGLIVSARNEVLISSGLRDKIRIVAAPTDAP
ncbi:MAG: FAD:protein FMN transferase [Acidobacteria bacterium]|nr:MAG: FAD:protein FMN transferase [Acidobacteriota bacterium]